MRNRMRNVNRVGQRASVVARALRDDAERARVMNVWIAASALWLLAAAAMQLALR